MIQIKINECNECNCIKIFLTSISPVILAFRGKSFIKTKIQANCNSIVISNGQ